MGEQKVQILECTLRDGSYAIEFQFTANDTAILAAELDRAGFGLIEVGHGVGLHASAAGKGDAAETDEAYLAAAAEAVKRGKFGMFCIPGIARLEDVDMAAGFGMGFIRVGTNVTEVAESEPFIARAKKHGMFVCANFMKSYAMNAAEWAQTAKLSRDFGADVVYIVDSAGGMLQSELDTYFMATRDVCDVPLGFHGHDNMGLAVAHSLRAVELGAVIVDGSLQGMGRSAGNAPTEILVAALNRMGIDLGIDLIEVLDIGEKYVKPFMKAVGLRSLDVVAGYSQFHSSFMGTIRKFSSKYRVDPRKLIIGVCARDKVNAPPALVEEVAKQLEAETDQAFTARYQLSDYFGAEQG